MKIEIHENRKNGYGDLIFRINEGAWLNVLTCVVSKGSFLSDDSIGVSVSLKPEKRYYPQEFANVSLFYFGKEVTGFNRTYGTQIELTFKLPAGV